MTRYADFLLVGGGLASATAAETLRTEGAGGSIIMLAAEPYLPYQRPPLSTQFLLEKSYERLPILDEAFYREHAIEVLLNTRASGLDCGNQIVQTDRAGDIHYGKLLIATGTSPIHLNVPGARLDGIHYLRTLDDAKHIKEAAVARKRAIVIGGSFLGAEIAASFAALGLRVTLLAMEDVMLEKLKSPVVSEFFGRYYREHGVEVIVGEEVMSFFGKDSVQGLTTRSGRTFRCDLVAVAIGVAPETAFLHGADIAVDNGVIVDCFLQASQPNVFAAGDVANFFDPVFNCRRRIEHWDNAIKQGRLAARNMLGQRQGYDEVSYFFCDVFNLSFDFFGVAESADEEVGRGSLREGGSFALFYLEDDVPRALFTLGRPAEETKAVEALIRYRVNLQPVKPRLADPTFSIEQMPSQIVLVLQGGGALGAFECGVVKALDEHQIRPDIVAGVSMGAFNGVVIAGNPKNPGAALEAFWRELAIETPIVPDENWRRTLSSWSSLMFGSPKFFRPLWFRPLLAFGDQDALWTSFYDTSPVKALLTKYVDFGRLRSSPIRLLVSAANVETAELEIFDSYVDDLTPDHIVASGSLPPGFPWTTIGGKHYWDGGIVSNSPLEMVVERCGTAGKRVFIVDLFPNRKRLPTNLMEVLVRRDEIVFAERIRRDTRTRDLVDDFRKLVEDIMTDLPADTVVKVKHRPRYVQLMGDVAPVTIIRIVREAEEDEPLSKDYDFSAVSLAEHIEKGDALTKKILSGMQKNP